MEACVHDWVDMYEPSGYSRKSPERYIVHFFCKKCLETHKKVVDISDQFIHPETLELFEENN